MSAYVTFSYADNLKKSMYSKLPDSLKISGSRDSEILLIIRLLSGNVELTHNYSNCIIKSRTNFFSSNFTPFQNWSVEFPVLFSDETTSNDIAIFITQNKFINRSFYSSVLSEISHFLLHTKRGSHTSAFIYIYRLLEKISYAFPLIYTSKTQDFLKSFGQLKELMIGDSEKKELGFFKTFITMLYAGDSISNTSVDICFNSVDEKVREQMFKSIKEVVGSTIVHENTIEHDILSINYCDMSSFIINIRNRFFHNLNGGATNLESNRIVDSDELFRIINPMAMYWLSMVFLQITSYSLSEFQTHRENALS